MKPKQNKCALIFHCTEPKKCVHYKRLRTPNPCRKCSEEVNKYCNSNFPDSPCYPKRLWDERECKHYSKGSCTNPIAQTQAITKCFEELGLVMELKTKEG